MFPFLTKLRKLRQYSIKIVNTEWIFEGYPMRYDVFEKDDLRRWAVE